MIMKDNKPIQCIYGSETAVNKIIDKNRWGYTFTKIKEHEVEAYGIAYPERCTDLDILSDGELDTFKIMKAPVEQPFSDW